MAAQPSWIQRARQIWSYHGQTRPPFAEPVGEGQESVWDYPRPPRLAADSREVVVRHDGLVVAATRSAVRVLETASPPTFYLPPGDVRKDLLTLSAGGSICEWKGRASYWTVTPPGRPPLHNAAWSYEKPFDRFESIAGWLSFYPSLVECYVDGVRVKPQPGGFYGGWVTPELAGPFKGLRGTEGW